MQFHYDCEHAIRNTDLVTLMFHKCLDCKGFCARQQRGHVCEARQAMRTKEDRKDHKHRKRAKKPTVAKHKRSA